MRHRDLVDLRIRDTDNIQDMLEGISFLRRDQLKFDVGKVFQSNARFGQGDRFEVHLDQVRMSVVMAKSCQE